MCYFLNYASLSVQICNVSNFHEIFTFAMKSLIYPNRSWLAECDLVDCDHTVTVFVPFQFSEYFCVFGCAGKSFLKFYTSCFQDLSCWTALFPVVGGICWLVLNQHFKTIWGKQPKSLHKGNAACNLILQILLFILFFPPTLGDSIAIAHVGLTGGVCQNCVLQHAKTSSDGENI